MKKSPAFQFYPNDWLSSTAITLMTPAEEGAYIRLLAIAWNSEDCGLPDNDEQLAILSRLGEGWLKGGSTKIRKCFFVSGEKLFNKRLLDERKKQEEWRKKSSEGGKKSAKKRWGSDKVSSKGGYKKVKDCLQPKVNSSSSSSSSSSKDLPSVKATPQKGNVEINLFFDAVKKETGLPPVAGQSARRLAYNFIRRLKKEYPDQNPNSLAQKIVQIAVGLNDGWHSTKAHDPKHLFYNWQEIVKKGKETKYFQEDL